jgi:hypothetical protein
MRIKELLNEDWNKVNKKDRTNGLSQKAVNAYRRENPGSKLQTAVTTKPSKLKKGSKAAKRRKSFCARMSGNKGPMKKPNGKPTPKALALRRWNCESIEQMAQMIVEGEQMVAREKMLAEKWTQKYKSSINCSHPKGFSQKAHCAGKKKHNESQMTLEMTCPDCGMCESHGSLNEIKKGAKDSNGVTKCWSGYHAAGTKKSATTGKQVRNCVPNESVSETANASLAWMEMSPEQQQAFSAKQKADRAFAANPVPAGLAWMEMSPEQQQIFSAKQKADRAAAALGLNERMMPSSTFTGSKKNKINGKGMLKATAKHARPGDLVGGG